MLYYETIDPQTLELLRKLQEIPSLRKTRLVGGTSLALQIGYPKFVDLDFFGEVDGDNDALTEELKSLGNLMVLKASSHLHIYLLNNIKIDIVDYAYPWLNEAIHIDGIQLADLTDIAAMKLAAITGRGTKKDFIDLYFLSKHFTLSEMQSFYERKYPDGSMFMVLKSLSYFEDAEQDPSPYMLEPIDWEEVKRHILSLL